MPATSTRLRRALSIPLLTLSIATLDSCSSTADVASAGAVNVVVGYQSKTINTVTAGTLLRDRGFFEKRLEEVGKVNGRTYHVDWQDYDTGAKITNQMLAEKVDIGSMGDFPILINGSKTKDSPGARTELLSITGYNLRGGLNTVVVPPDSTARSLADLKGKHVSTSVGSAGHGLLVRALQKAGLGPSAVQVQNQDPQVGASALEAGQVAALSQFVAWPGLLVEQGKAKVLYDGAQLDYPTFHGVLARKAYSGAHPEVTQAFLRSVIDATDDLHAHPLDAAKVVAKATGLPADVVYLYNGLNGISTFDVTLKPQLLTALADDIPFLKSIGVLQDFTLDGFVNDTYLRKAYGSSYDAERTSTANAAALTGTDSLSKTTVEDVATASELWVDGATATEPAVDPTSLLAHVAAAKSAGKKIIAAYVPDAATGTRWFADKSTWVRSGDRFLPFISESQAATYLGAHPGTSVISYDDAVTAATEAKT